MPRLARNVFSNIPHHITQRGNRREDVFFTQEDRQCCLEWLGIYCQKWQVDILAYCLMSNHIHLVLASKTEEGLQRVLKPLPMRYAQRINQAKGWKAPFGTLPFRRLLPKMAGQYSRLLPDE